MVVNNQLVDFTSAARYERIALKNHITVTTNGSVVAINHNLGYKPFFKVFVKFPGNSYYEPASWGPFEPSGYFDYQLYTGVLDNNKIELGIFNNTANPDTQVDIFYRIYAEPQQ